MRHPHSLRRVALLAAALAAAVATAPPARVIAQPASVQPADSTLTLGGAARLAAARSAPVEAARARAERAGALVTQSRAALLPDLSLGAATRQRTFNTAEMGITFPAAPGQPPLFDPDGEVIGPVNVYDVRGRLSQRLFDPAAAGRLGVARASARASEAEVGSQGQLAAGQAAVAYVRALRADAQVAARAADSALAAELVEIAREQLRVGTGVALDVTRAQAQQAAARAGLLGARAERDRARLDLARAVGLSLDVRLSLRDSLVDPLVDEETGAAAPPAVPNETDAVRRALAGRADLRAAEAQIAVAERQARAIRAERLPTVSAFLDDGAIGRSVDHLKHTYAWGLQASVPLFEGFRREGRQEEQAAVARELDVRRRDLVEQTTLEVRSALLDLQATQEQAAATRERLQLAEQEVAQARDRFRAGVAGNADVITASISLNAARTAHVDALAAHQAARVALARAQGAVTALP